MHYFASIESGTCSGDNERVDEIDIGYCNCGGNCIQIVQWNPGEMEQDYISLTPQMAVELMDALIKWHNK